MTTLHTPSLQPQAPQPHALRPHAPRPQLPPGSCDCHTHVFLNARDYPLAASRRYTPPPASIDQLAALHDALGIQRVVIVQPSVYALDNAATLQALRVLGPQRARGVAVIDDATSDAALDAMHAAGVRGVRVNLEIDAEHDAGKATAWMRSVADRIGPRGWHMQVFANLPLLGACSTMLGTLGLPLVFDHYAGAQARLGLQQEGLAEVLRLVEDGKAYVKLSALYRCSDQPDHADMEALTRLFIGCNAERMLWGSDWPHPRPGVRPRPEDVCPPYDVDLAAAIDALQRWASDDVTVRKIFVANPQRLYGFDP
ncbi:amidohydrolase family protein [soil metagenome]